jgi:hypothetical protein
MEPFAGIFPDPATPKVSAITRPKSPSGETRPALGDQAALCHCQSHFDLYFANAADVGG